MKTIRFSVMSVLLLALLSAFITFSISSADAQTRTETGGASYRFTFGSGKDYLGFTPVTAASAYSVERGYGFLDAQGIQDVERDKFETLHSHFCVSDKPFFFTVDVPEGNYKVAVTLGDSQGASVTTIKAEARRLMVEKAQTARGKFTTQTFTVNVRRPALASGETVRLKADERGSRDWDGRLTLEFSNARPCLAALVITRVDDAPTVFIAGDSTVCDQNREPWCAWGQMLPRFFNSDAAVANYAESGETLRSFMAEKRLAKLLEIIRAGDYLFIQFGHNDMKERGVGVGAFTTYKADLKHFIAEARLRKATPVLLTPMNRRTFDAQGAITNSFGDYPDAVRQTAREENVALIDLHAMSKTLYEALGPDKSRRAFVQYPVGTFPGQDKELRDNTHFNPYGAYELARCVVEGIKAAKLDLVRCLTSDAGAFDPAHPDPVETWQLPASPLVTTATPEGK